jgi:hypothetical protein
MERIPHPGDITPRRADLGVVALVALDAETLLVLERSFVQGTRAGTPSSRNDILISRVRTARADDVRAVESLRESLLRPVEKQVLLSLGDLAAQLPPWLAALENFEGMTFGPPFPGGDQSLVLVADDNFNPGQRNAFVVLRVRGL